MSNIRLSKSGIEYLDYVWNFYSGCENPERGICSLGNVCWAKKITERFSAHYPNGFKPTFYPGAIISPLRLTKPARIGVCFMGDLFGDWNFINQGELPSLLWEIIRCCPQHTFIFLTKCPWNLIKFSPFPDNCWVGVTVTNDKQMNNALYFNSNYKVKIKFLSFEPLLGQIDKAHLAMYRYDWLIIGACTGTMKELLPLHHKTGLPMIRWRGNKWILSPPIGAVEEIVLAADKAGIPVFLKNNLAPVLEVRKPFIETTRSYTRYPRQEMP